MMKSNNLNIENMNKSNKKKKCQDLYFILMKTTNIRNKFTKLQFTDSKIDGIINKTKHNNVRKIKLMAYMMMSPTGDKFITGSIVHQFLYSTKEKSRIEAAKDKMTNSQKRQRWGKVFSEQ